MRSTLLFLGLLACTNTPADDTTDDTEVDTDVDTEETDDTEPVEDTDPTFTRVRAEVLNASCSLSTCHGAAEGQSGLKLGGTSAEDHAQLVGAAVETEGKESEFRVIAGDSANSYLVKKMAAAEGIEGDSMPPGFQLSADLRQLVIDWIDAGALDN